MQFVRGWKSKRQEYVGSEGVTLRSIVVFRCFCRAQNDSFASGSGLAACA